MKAMQRHRTDCQKTETAEMKAIRRCVSDTKTITNSLVKSVKQNIYYLQVVQTATCFG